MRNSHFISFFFYWSATTSSGPLVTNIDLLNPFLTLVFPYDISSWLDRGVIFYYCHLFFPISFELLRSLVFPTVFSAAFGYLTENKHATAQVNQDLLSVIEVQIGPSLIRPPGHLLHLISASTLTIWYWLTSNLLLGHQTRPSNYCIY